jgi:hypothetical protein
MTTTTNKSPSVLCELCTQTDWSKGIRYPGYRAILLLLIVALNETWVSYTSFCQTVPFFSSSLPKNDGTPEALSSSSMAMTMTTAEWRRSHQACLDAICDISDKIQFDCKVDETGQAAHMLILDADADDESAQLQFESEIPIPKECIDATNLILGTTNMNELKEFIQSHLFEAETINFFHYYQNPGLMEDDSEKKKAVFQLLPGQCSIWEIFQQSWYEWFEDTPGRPPPPVSLINFAAVQPGQVVHVEASDFLCYKRYVEEKDMEFWINFYELLLKYRWHLSCCVLFVISLALEGMSAMAAMVRLLPLTGFFVTINTADDHRGGNKFITVLGQVWRIWKVLLSLCAITFAVSESDQIYVVCALAAGSMVLYNNSKAAMEWGFLHILSYIPESEHLPVVDMVIKPIVDLIDLFLPVPGLLWKFVAAYMIYMVFPRLRG